MRRAAAVLALVAAFGGLSTAVAPAASAACDPPVPAGAPLSPGEGRAPLIDRLGLPRVWELSTGRGVTVAVVDSGVDARHPKLAGAVGPPTDFRISFTARAGFEQGPGTGDDCENHGTPIAGIIAARAADDGRVVGVAPDATIAPVRFAGSVAQAPVAEIAAAIRAGADRGSVLNLSFAVPVDAPPIAEAVRYALDRDVVVVAAAGNENRSQPGLRWFPAAYDGVLAVASIDGAGQPADDSNRGPWVDVAAPGVALKSPSSGGDGFTDVTGTSFATAVVSGVAALVRARFPELSGPDVVRRIERTAVSLTGGRDDRTGAGIVDVYQALTAVDVPATPAAPAAAAAGAIRVLPVPVDPPLLTPVGAIAAAAAAVLLAAAGVAAACGTVASRVAARRGTGGRYAPVHRPVTPVPEDRLG